MTLALLLLAVAAGDTTVSLTADAATVRLSGVVRLTLTIEGPPPLRVEPADGLDAESAAAWKLSPDGPPTLEAGRWVQRYVADPFVPGEAVRLGVGPVAVWAGGAGDPQRLTPEPLTVRVTTGVADVSPLSARPPSGVEALPDPPPYRTLAATVEIGVVSTVVVFLVVFALAYTSRLKRRRPVPSADPLAGLDELPDAAFAHRLSDAVRGRLHTTVVPARRLTTPELLAAMPDPQHLRPLLERLDAVRFGGGPLTAAERAAMLEGTRTVLQSEATSVPN